MTSAQQDLVISGLAGRDHRVYEVEFGQRARQFADRSSAVHVHRDRYHRRVIVLLLCRRPA